MPRILFRADGNAHMGLGHVMRCLALADMLSSRFQCVFVMRTPGAELQRQVVAAGHQVTELPADLTTADSEAAWLKQQLQPHDLVVLDGYGFDATYQETISREHFGLAYLDDLITTPAWADVVINQAGGVSPDAYASSPGASLCLGPAYALLRRPFQAAAGQQTAVREWSGQLFLNMGGADPGNETLTVLAQLLEVFPGHEIAVVTGAAYPHQALLTAFAAPFPTVKLYHNLTAPQLSQLLLRCDIMVCPPSGMAYECCATGGLLLLHQTAGNQQAMFDFLLDNNLAMALAELPALDTGDAAHLAALATELRARQNQLFDGQSGSRLMAAFTELHQTALLTIRQATAADCTQYFNWANDADVRRNAIQTAPIPWPAHQAWFTRRLAAADSYLYVIESAGQSVGQVRIDFTDTIGTIDYSVAAAWRGRGLGQQLLRRAIHRLRHERPGTWTLRGEVKTNNQASCRVFERLRFTHLPAVRHEGELYEVFELLVNSGL